MFRRRTRADTPFGRDRKDAHAFRVVHEPEVSALLGVCLDSSSLSAAKGPEREAVELLAELRDSLGFVFRTPEVGPDEIAGIPSYEAGTPEAGVTQVRLSRGGHEYGVGVFEADLPGLAQEWFGDPAAFGVLDRLRVAEAMSADIFVTLDRRLLARRGQPPSWVPVLRPTEAVPLVWTWARAQGEHWDGHTRTQPPFYYWALARALTPSAWPGFAGFVYGEYRFDGGEELMDLAGSALSRLSAAVNVIDKLYVAWQLPADNYTLEEVGSSFDHLVLIVAALHDNLALLAGKYLGIQDLPLIRWSLTEPKFRRALRRVADPRASELAAYLAGNAPRLSLHLELRHHAIHRAQLRPMRFRGNGQSETGRIFIPEPTLGLLWNLLTGAQRSPADWGLSDRTGPHEVTFGFVDQPGREEVRDDPGGAFLDPMPFAIRLARDAARTLDKVFRVLAPHADARLTPEDRAACARRSTQWPMREVDSSRLLMTSFVGDPT